jgi:purine-nucleoside phosphorylase
MIETEARSATEAVAFLRQVSKEVPAAAVVLGSGVKVLEDLDEQSSFSYDQVFGMSPSIVGHAGSLSLGRVGGKLTAVLRGRFHLYEGHGWDVVTLPTRVLMDWGVPNLYLTNAAGGLNPAFRVGDLMLLTGYRDHLNPKWKETGLIEALRKPTVACENALGKRIAAVGAELAARDKEFRPLRQGSYAGLLGPSYETLAEIEMLKRLKADAVGMSTVPELETARGTGTVAAAISVITNVWSEDTDIEGHEEVLRAAKEASERLDKLFRACISAS